MSVTITLVNPLDHADEIKRLFLTHGRPEFPAFFDRAYPAAVGRGARSWLGRDAAGRLVMHAGCFPKRFRFGQQEVSGGLMVNALVASAFRGFFPARDLILRAREDCRAQGDLDFLYADPNDQARAVMQVSGFKRVGVLTRFVLPVGHRRWFLDRSLRVWQAIVRLAIGAITAAPLVPHLASDFSTAELEVPSGASPRLRPYHSKELYAARLEGYPSTRDWWFTLQRNGPASPPAAGLLVRGPDPAGIAVLHAIHRDPELSLARVIPGLVTALRATACTRLYVSALGESLLSDELRRVGFVRREQEAVVLGMALTEAGEAVVRSSRQWEITHLDCDR